MQGCGTQELRLASAGKRRYLTARSKYALRTIWRSSGATLIAVLVSQAIPGTGYPQTLDKAVNNQLEIGQVVGIPCEQLLSRDPTQVSKLTGGLSTICRRFVLVPGAGPSASTGGGAATPTTLPSVVQQRLREARGEEKEPEAKVTAASADAAIERRKRRGLFVSVGGEEFDHERTRFVNRYDSRIKRLVVGVDFQTTARWVAGFAFDASRQDGDFEGGGDFEVNGGITLPLTPNLTMTPSINYSVPFGSLSDSDDGNYEDEFYWGIGLSYTF